MRLALLTALAFAVLLASSVFAYAQEDADAPPPTVSEKAAAFIAEVKGVAGKQEEKEDVKAVNRLLGYCQSPDLDDKIRKTAVGLLDKLAKDDRDAVGVLALKALGGSRGGSNAAKKLFAHIKKLTKEKEPRKNRINAAFTSLRALADPSKGTVGGIIKLMRDNDPGTAAQAVLAASGYAKAEGAVRKELFEAILKQTEGPANAAKSDPNSSQARRWNQMSSATRTAFKALGGKSFPSPAEARSWFNEHKKDREVWK